MKLYHQLVPLLLTVLTFLLLSLLLLGFIHLLNLLPITDKILPVLRIVDIGVGLTIYLKTSIDFAIFMGNLMHHNPGTKNRIAIEIGTALGNFVGTLLVLIIWTFFKEVQLLMVLMIFIASLVLFQMAEEGLTEYSITNDQHSIIRTLLNILRSFNNLFRPVLSFIIPHSSVDGAAKKTFLALLGFAFTVPLILGLDDFAGYIPLFNIVNVFGFAVGVFLGHMLLNIALFANPQTTTKIVRLPIILLLGSIAFVGIALWGWVEIGKIVLQILH